MKRTYAATPRGRLTRHRRPLLLTLIAGVGLAAASVSTRSQSRISLGPSVAGPRAMLLQKDPAQSSSGITRRASSSDRDRAELPRLVSLRLVPQDVTLWGIQASQRFLVIGKFADGMERDLTGESRFSVSDPQLAKIDESGRAEAVANGKTVLKAENRGQTTRTSLRIEGSQEKRPFSFAQDLGGVFTKRGCNSSDCHGSVKGKGGFKLSLNALYPRDDYKWIVEGGTYQVLAAEANGEKIPRINPKEPEKSLLLLKPTMGAPHGGGERFSVGSADYQTILQWIRSGAPYGEEGREVIKVTGIEVFPKEAVLDPKGKHRLLVTARLSNGRQEDFTDKVFYVSNNTEVVKVGTDGLVEAVRTGETAVMIRAAGYAVSARFGVVENPFAKYPEIARRNLIDDHVFAKLRKFNILPSALSSDQEFLRRACLDIAGTLPPPDRVREFLASKDPAKRDKLIEILLDSPEYVDYWTFRFSDLYRVSLYGAGFTPKKTHPYWEWIRDSIAQNKPYDQMARERIAAQGAGAATAHYMPGEFLPQDMMAEQVRVFLGRRLDCAQCHNHPYETWAQDQFWGMTAFFGRVSAVGSVLTDLPGGGFAKGGTAGPEKPIVHPKTKKEVQPVFLDGKVLPAPARTDLRMELAQWMISQPYFSEAIVNRMWSYFFGRGIVDPVDDFRSTNPPTHPELLEALARDFKEHGYDLKHFIRTIVQSKTYQLSGIPNRTNEGDKINYSRALPRPLDAEVLLDAISAVTGVPEVFERASGAGGKEPPGTRAIEIKDTDAYPSRFLDMYGRPDRMMVPERDGKANLTQALHMLAGPTYTDKLSKPGSRIDRLLKRGATDREIIEELCLAALSRFPAPEERKDLEALVAGKSARRQALEDLLWGLINSREFAYKH